MNYKIVIAGCTKNSASYISSHLLLLVEIGKLFQSYNILIYENDSTDNTCELLTSFKKDNSNFDFIHEENVIERLRVRTHHIRAQTIAHGRNQLLKVISHLYSNYDFMIMLDLDNVLDRFKPKHVFNIFNYGNVWDVLTANCINKYYDIWALRIPSTVWNQAIHGKIWNKPLAHDCWTQMVDNIQPRECVKNYQKLIPIKFPLIETESSFGGLGIYKISAIKGCSYDSFNNNIPQCEHVGFHKAIVKNGGRIFICPSLLINCPVEHLQ
jgi:hypothetical protein